jgi:tRNA(Ile)-lysidine synthase
MLIAVRSFIDSHCLLARGDKVLAACSGGPDSLALVHILASLAGEYGIGLAVAHVNHGMRGAEADADAAFVGEFCAGLGLPFYQTKVDMAAYAAESGLNKQEAGRLLRYRYLRQVAAELGGALIATGHNRGDQAETVLLSLFRGAGGDGIAGMKPAESGLIRPLLAVERPAIDAYCRENGLEPRLDKSNLKTDYRRNFLRLKLMPLIEREINPNLVDTLCRAAEIIGDEHELVAELARAAWPEVVSEDEVGLALDCRQLESLHVAVRRELVRQAIEKKRGNLRGISFFHVERLLEKTTNGSTGSVLELPGNLVARKDYGKLVLTEPATPPGGIKPPGVTLAVPGITPVPVLGLTVVAELAASRPPEAGPGSAVFDWEALTPPLFIRTRKDGDRFRPAGGAGGKKLKEYFIDVKVPRWQRDRVPVFADSRDIIWLGGFRQAERGQPGPATKKFLQITIKKRED